MRAFKKILLLAYGGFADKRIKDIDKSDMFTVDDRDEPDLGYDRKPLSSFCKISVKVRSNKSVTVTLFGNIPAGKDVKLWLARHNCEIRTPARQSMLEFNVKKGNNARLNELADAIEQFVETSELHHIVKSNKFVCLRTAKSLRHLNAILDEAWPLPLPSATFHSLSHGDSQKSRLARRKTASY
jgi:hypothetical protein